MRASGLRAVASASVLAVVLGVARFALALAPDAHVALLQTSLGLTVVTVGVFWIWGTIRAARGDDGAGAGLFALAATVALATVALEAIVAFDPLLELELAFGREGATRLAAAARVCRVAAQIAFAVALARIAWYERHGTAMFGAAVAVVISAPMLVFDPVALALARPRASVVGGLWLDAVPAVLAGVALVTAIWALPVPIASLWRVFGRPLELVRLALAGLVVVAVSFIAALACTAADPSWLRAAMLGPITVLGTAVAFGALRTARRSIRWTRWSFTATAVLTLVLVVLQLVVVGLVPLGQVALAPAELVMLDDAGLVVTIVALALLVLGCARVDVALRRPARAVAVMLGATVCAGLVAIALRTHPLVQQVGMGIVAALVLLGLAAAIMSVRLLGRGVAVAEARAYGERVRAVERAADEARRVHEEWRAARRR